MKCPNPKCSCKKFLPADANFCPECGTQLRPGKVVFIPDSTLKVAPNIKYCTPYPTQIKQGERSILKWEGQNVKSIRVDGHEYPSNAHIYLSPSASKEYSVDFISESGKVTCKLINIEVNNGLLFQGKGKEMPNGSIKIDLRQVTYTYPKKNIWDSVDLANAHYHWDIITGIRNVKAYVAEDEKLEFIFNNNGRLIAINFYPNGKDNNEKYSSIMTIPFGRVKKTRKRTFWEDEEFFIDVQLTAKYKQDGIENINAEQWWSLNDLNCMNYLKLYENIIEEHIGINILRGKIWQGGEWRNIITRYYDQK